MQPKQQQINVQLGEKESEGIYSNLALIVYSPSEIIFDFARMMPGVPKAKVYSRVIMTPQHAKMFLNALEGNIKKYEDQFGAIKVHGKPDKSIGFQSQYAQEPTKEE